MTPQNLFKTRGNKLKRGESIPIIYASFPWLQPGTTTHIDVIQKYTKYDFFELDYFQLIVSVGIFNLTGVSIIPNSFSFSSAAHILWLITTDMAAHWEYVQSYVWWQTSLLVKTTFQKEVSRHHRLLPHISLPKNQREMNQKHAAPHVFLFCKGCTLDFQGKVEVWVAFFFFLYIFFSHPCIQVYWFGSVKVFFFFYVLFCFCFCLFLCFFYLLIRWVKFFFSPFVLFLFFPPI